MIREHDIIKIKIDLNDNIKAGTIGVILSIYENGKFFLVEFVDKNNQTIGDGMTLVDFKDIELVSSHSKGSNE
ncbi:uncharacterized protein DUF4926 [Flavobacterium sp. 90]|uniref:DUF4926 domain-containing protein n=1 Tax=unclassified Flavobacterium TaxID=196869 RepID=UPI000EB475F7|nr:MULTISPECIES: DUF4926 domain-containing protein [unclassified Flavobacterium]RKR09068.1 uncharacterized protein DUF4926 [Flavobacterium sp. 81]TCK52852.1 uncharacterized protein DUF4926 [Flavobacterium sp. 90]